jgi:hypothetical protein
VNKQKIKEWGLVGMVALLSITANLPADFAPAWLNRKYLVFMLVLIVVMALVRYLQFALVLVVAILTIGVNLPQAWGEDFGIRQDVMFFALAAMVALSFLNYSLKLPKGAKPMLRLQNENGARALCNAAIKGRASMVYTLISVGMDLNAPDSQGNTPLILAASQGHSDAVKVLIDNGADVNARDAHGRSALIWALDRRHSQTVMLLRHAGAVE